MKKLWVVTYYDRPTRSQTQVWAERRVVLAGSAADACAAVAAKVVPIVDDYLVHVAEVLGGVYTVGVERVDRGVYEAARRAVEAEAASP